MAKAKYWTSSDDDKLMQMKEQGYGIDVIAKYLNRTSKAVTNRYYIVKNRIKNGEYEQIDAFDPIPEPKPAKVVTPIAEPISEPVAKPVTKPVWFDKNGLIEGPVKSDVALKYKRTNWTDAENDLVMDLYSKGYDYDYISTALNRTNKACRSRVSTLKKKHKEIREKYLLFASVLLLIAMPIAWGLL